MPARWLCILSDSLLHGDAVRHLSFLLFLGCAEKGEPVDAYDDDASDGPGAVDPGDGTGTDTDSGEDDTGEVDPGPSDDPEDEVFSLPGEGHWTYGEGEEVGTTDCPTGTDDGTGDASAAGFILANTGEGAFSITADGADTAVSCLLDGDSFVCDHSVDEQEVLIPEAYEDGGQMVDLEMVLEVSTAMSGAFHSNGSMQVDFSIEFDCVSAGDLGSVGCMFVSELPCSLAFTASAELD